MRWIPLVLFLIYAAVTAIRTLLHWRATGINPYVLPNDDSPEGYIGWALRWVMGGVLIAAVGHGAGWDESFGVLPWAREATAFWIGAMLVSAAVLWTAVAQAQMGGAWRIGIDHERATALVHHGLFRVSRNPIFLGARVALVGGMLLVPNTLMLATTLAAEVLIQLQTRLEEAHLRTLHGDSYGTYARSVRRWLGRG